MKYTGKISYGRVLTLLFQYLALLGCTYMYLIINGDYKERLIEILVFMLIVCLIVKNQNTYRYSYVYRKDFFDVKNILCIHHSCLTTVVF